MDPNLNTQLIEIRSKLQDERMVESQLKAVEQDLASQRDRLSELSKTLEREGTDVKRLEGLSLAGLFYTILGNKDEQLDRERQEYLAAKLHYDQAAGLVARLESDRDALQVRLAGMRALNARYQALLTEKERILLAENGATGARLSELAGRIAANNSQIKELSEALSAAQAASRALTEALDALNSAGNWGVVDLFGGGLITDAVKHSHIDDARQAVEDAQEYLQRLKRELADVATDLSSVIEVGSLATFADFFFDDLITDWVVQSKIHDSEENVGHMRVQIDALAQTLERQLSAARVEAGSLQAEHQGLLEES